MTRPDLTPQQVHDIVPEASDVQPHDLGGQKVVFTALIDGQKYALKFLSPKMWKRMNIPATVERAWN